MITVAIWKRTMISMALVGVMSPSLFVGYQHCLNSLLPVTSDSLECTPIEIGEVGLKEDLSIGSVVCNRSRRAVRLLPPIKSCGCLSVDAAPDVLQPGETSEIRLTFRTPKIPGSIEKQVVLISEDFPAIKWTIGIRGRASGPVWLETPEVILELDENGVAEKTLFVHHRPNVTLGGVRSDRESIRAELRITEGNAQRLVISLANAPENTKKTGNATVFIMEAKNPEEVALSIPITWRPTSGLECRPTSLRLDGYGQAPDQLTRTVLIRGLRDNTAGSLTAEPLVDWVKVKERQVIGNIVQLRLAFDSPRMPENILHEILQVSQAGEDAVTVSAAGRR